MDNAPSLHADVTTRLAPISDTPALDASVLIAHVTDKPRTWVIAHPELTLTSAQQKQLDDSLVRLQGGEPLPYILGRWEFFGLQFDITPDVLIPRPETEVLVEKAISWLKKSSRTSHTVVDVGTGSGSIAVSIAVHAPDVNIIATDVSPKALQVAKRNAQKFCVENRIEFIECDLLPAKRSIVNDQSPWGRKQSSIHLLCANLPYIPTKKLHKLPVYHREPTLALDGGKDGLDHIQRLLTLAPEWLAPNGLLLLEIESTQGEKAFSRAREAFPKAEIYLHQDLAGRDRLLCVNSSPINI